MDHYSTPALLGGEGSVCRCARGRIRREQRNSMRTRLDLGGFEWCRTVTPWRGACRPRRPRARRQRMVMAHCMLMAPWGGKGGGDFFLAAISFMSEWRDSAIAAPRAQHASDGSPPRPGLCAGECVVMVFAGCAAARPALPGREPPVNMKQVDATRRGKHFERCERCEVRSETHTRRRRRAPSGSGSVLDLADEGGCRSGKQCRQGTG